MKQMVQKSLIVLAIVLAIGSLSATTIGWWGFEGTPGQEASIGTIFPNRANPETLPAEVYARYSGSASTDYQPRFIEPIWGPYGVGDSTVTKATKSALLFTQPVREPSRSMGCPIRVADTDGALDKQTFTLEGWFKMDPSDGANIGWRTFFSKGYGPYEQGSGFYYTFALFVEGTPETYQTIKAYFYVRDAQGNAKAIENKVFKEGINLRDGKWHYISLAVNGSTHVAHLFVDYYDDGTPSWQAQIDLGGDLIYNPDEPLVIGGNNLANWQYCGAVDEVRFSDHVCNTSDLCLKKRGIADGTVIGQFPMEGDCKSTVWPEYWPDPEMTAASGGAVPTFTDLEERKRHVDKDGQRIGRTIDVKCLDLNKGKVRWTDSELLAGCADSLTIEFFMNAKASANADWASVVRTDYTMPNGGSTVLPWNLGFHPESAGKDFAYRFDTEGYVNYYKNNGTTYLPFDGKWHHVAISLARTGTSSAKTTAYSVWVDYEKRISGETDGWTIYPTGTHLGFGLAGTPFVGRIDEVRMTKGIVPVDDFMRLGSLPGLAIILR